MSTWTLYDGVRELGELPERGFSVGGHRCMQAVVGEIFALAISSGLACSCGPVVSAICGMLCSCHAVIKTYGRDQNAQLRAKSASLSLSLSLSLPASPRSLQINMTALTQALFRSPNCYQIIRLPWHRLKHLRDPSRILPGAGLKAGDTNLGQGA